MFMNNAGCQQFCSQLSASPDSPWFWHDMYILRQPDRNYKQRRMLHQELKLFCRKCYKMNDEQRKQHKKLVGMRKKHYLCSVQWNEGLRESSSFYFN